MKAASPLLREQPGIDFSATWRRATPSPGQVQVLVADGFAGNVLLKSTEGAVGFLFAQLKSAMTSSFLTKLGALLLKPKLREMKHKLDYQEYGGAVLLGIDGVMIKAHGFPSAHAFAGPYSRPPTAWTPASWTASRPPSPKPPPRPSFRPLPSVCPVHANHPHSIHTNYLGGIAMFEKVRAIIAEQLGIDKEKIQPESHLINDLKADSLDVVALVMDLEQEYGIEIPDEGSGPAANRAEHPGLHRQAGK